MIEESDEFYCLYKDGEILDYIDDQNRATFCQFDMLRWSYLQDIWFSKDPAELEEIRKAVPGLSNFEIKKMIVNKSIQFILEDV